MSTVNTQGIDQLLQELNRMSAQAGGQPEPSNGPTSAEFGAALQAALQQVSDAQNEAARLQQDFDVNAPNTNLHEVMVSLQKASLSFQTMVQVRNRLVSAYQEIMNMQV
ncbi:MAG TPA: flagellar hook-basal body complex protein FliE [Burkholderiales bacterium]|nr:flagellar hook-basal body complex protein FliE [Burkholderiales bacterium]